MKAVGNPKPPPRPGDAMGGPTTDAVCSILFKVFKWTYMRCMIVPGTGTCIDAVFPLLGWRYDDDGYNDRRRQWCFCPDQEDIKRSVEGGQVRHGRGQTVREGLV